MSAEAVQSTSPALRHGDQDWLERLPTAALILDPLGAVAAANRAARRLFVHLDPVGLPLDTVLRLSGAGGDLDVLDEVVAGRRGAARLNLADERIFDLRAAAEAEGAVVTLVEVSDYIREAERGTKDALTGLLNRAGLQARLQQMLAANSADVALLYIDLDRFKAVNDTLGHPVGDALLLKVTDRLRSAAEKGDVIARMGGDEFVVVQSGGGQPRAAEALAARLIDLLARTYVAGGHMLNVGASVGVALAEAGVGVEALIKRADLALYRAKLEGKGQFRFFEPAMDAALQARRAMELDLRRALGLREFELAFQPQYRLESHTLIGFEALVRWHSPTRGPVSPAEFIPLAEEIGLMVPLGEWVLRTACKAAAGWARPLSVAVNLSPVQFQSAKLVATVMSALAEAQLDPARLELEITEGVLLDDTTAVLEVLTAIRSLGVRISMDDFGTGYSSLSYLQKFPFSKIKIDQSFVRRMNDDPESRAIVRAVAALGASLGMTTTAEGVETEAQLDHIRREGCTDVQGYLTGRPMSGGDAAALAAQTP